MMLDFFQLPSSILFDIGLVFVFAALVAFIARLIKQPLIPAYIIAGLILGPIGLSIIHDTTIIKSISEIGIIFLLFIVGMEMDLKSLRNIGWTTLIVGSVQVVLTFLLGYFTALNFLGFDGLNSIYAGLVLAFSSTMIVVKLLSDENELNTLHGRIIVGVLFLQDIFVILALTILMGTSTFSFELVYPIILKFLGLLLIAFLLNRFVVKKVFGFAAKSQELLFLLSLAICFLFVFLAYLFGFSISIGAFIAGITIASLPYNLNIVAKISSLKDFFSVVFFVGLGLQLGIVNFDLVFIPLLAFLLITFLFKPLIILILLSILGYDKRIAFTSAISLAQLSEFSLILVMYLSNVNEVLFTTTILAAVISIGLTAYLIKYELELFLKIAPLMRLFERMSLIKRNGRKELNEKKQVILFGYHRLGQVLLKKLILLKKNALVIDYNPEAIHKLREKKISAVYGDMANQELLNEINFDSVKIIISTVPKLNDTIMMLDYLKARNINAQTFVTANDLDDALTLYKNGTNYVILPHLMSGEGVSLMLGRFIDNKKMLVKLRKEHINHIIKLKNERL